MNKGFTLIEMIVYIALFALLLAGGITTAVQLSFANAGAQENVSTQREGNFVLQKIHWALVGSELSTPTGSGCEQSISLIKFNHSQNPIVFQRNAISNAIEIVEGSAGVPTPLTSTNVKAECLTFSDIPESGSRPRGVAVTVRIDGKEFILSSYSRK